MQENAWMRGRAELPDHLTGPQVAATELILYRVAKIIHDLRDAKSKQYKTAAVENARPHHAFLIDGARGAGKTYSLATVEAILRRLSDPKAGRIGEEEKAGHISEEEWAQWLKLSTIPPELQFKPENAAAAKVLRIIFPGDMERGDSLMEAVFTGVRDSLEKLQKQADDRADKRGDEKAKELIRKLREEVSQGWYYGHQFGIDALIRDSVDYADLVSNFEKQSGKAAHRAEKWYEYVDQYLNFLKVETLVVMLDDSDVGPEATSDILQSARMSLSHPRIVTIIAGNLDSMRGSLIQQAMDKLSPAIGSLASTDSRTARDWRRGHRQLVEEYLDKVLPPANRFYLRPIEATPGRARGDTDFKRIATAPLEDFVKAAHNQYRKLFLDAKFRLALDREISGRDVPTATDIAPLEAYLSWWFFSDRYRDLAPRVPRQIATFRDFFQWMLNDAARPKHEPKRLLVALFHNPANFLLIQRLGDIDSKIPDWLRQQVLESFWYGRRLFRINGRELEEGSYPHRYIAYRLDVGLGLPLRDNEQAAVATSLLPRPAGRQVMRRFLQAREMPRRPRSLGLSRWIDHAAIPANCLYFDDLDALPDIAFLDTHTLKPRQIADNQEGLWESYLSSRIYEIIDDRRGERRDFSAKDRRRAALKDEYLFRYVREIVCESLRFSSKVTSATLLAELDPADILLKQRTAIYEHFIRHELDSFAESIEKRCEGWWFAFGKNARADIETPPKGSQEDRRAVALYSCLITDLRRAWHAIRVHEAAPSLRPSDDESAARASLAALTTRDRMPLYTRQQIEALLGRSRWTQAALKVFALDNVTRCFKGHDRALTLNDIGKIYAAPGDIKVAPPNTEKKKKQFSDVQSIDEREDFEKWTRTLRKIGRMACKNWPVYDAEPLVYVEEELFEVSDGQAGAPYKTARFDIFEKNQTPDQEDAARSNARQARKLVWLLHGLAPSLPAIIHSEIMAMHYQVVLLEKAAYEDQFLSQREKLLGLADDLYLDAAQEIENWAKLVGTLSVILRYIKIKALHLDVSFILREARTRLKPKPEQESSNAEKAARAARELETLLRDCGYKFNGPVAIDIIVDKLLIAFENKGRGQTEPKVDEVSPMNLNLSTFPDNAPSTLFGEDWLKDILARPSLMKDTGLEGEKRESLDDGISVNGVFGETEQWLWTANRGLRKLSAVLLERNKTYEKKTGRKRAREPGTTSSEPAPARPVKTRPARGPAKARRAQK